VADISNINPVKPLWPVRRDEKNPEKDQPGNDKEKGQHSPNAEKPTSHKSDPDHDGQIDEYV
jgi:hypothetical protein